MYRSLCVKLVYLSS